jgi:hypothetical protein
MWAAKTPSKATALTTKDTKEIVCLPSFSAGDPISIRSSLASVART